MNLRNGALGAPLARFSNQNSLVSFVFLAKHGYSKVRRMGHCKWVMRTADGGWQMADGRKMNK